MKLVGNRKLTVGLGVLLIALAGCSSPSPSASSGDKEAEPESPTALASAEATKEEQIQRGQHLSRIGGCNDCHTPWVFDPDLGMPRPDMSRMFSGHPEGAPDPEGTVGAHDMGLIGPTFTSFALPFGIIYSPNLTPDMDTGIGSWTEEMFLGIFRKGRHLGGDGRGVLPPMPWLWIRNFSDADLRALFAYLNSLPPIRNAVPEPKIPDEVIWQLRDGMDRVAAELPQEEWAAKKQ